MIDVTWIEGISATVAASLLTGAAIGVKKAYQKLMSIEWQNKPNGGSSLRDAVDRIEKGVNDVRREVVFQGCEAKLSGDISRRNTFRTDEHGSNVAVSRSYCRTLGYLMEDLEDDRWKQIIHPDDRAAYLARLSAAIEVQGRFEAQVRLMKADGSAVRVLVQAEPVLIEGEFQGLAGEWERLADPVTG